MAPMMEDQNEYTNGTTSKPHLAIIGAGSRGNAYARATVDSGLGVVAAVIEPIAFKRRLLGSKFIWGKAKPSTDQEFSSWEDFIAYQQQRRKDEAAGKQVPPGVDGVFVCVRDELHVKVVTALAPLELHVMCEKPLATSLQDCLKIQKALQSHEQRVFAIGHVLRYSPHNLLLRHLVREQNAIGEVLSIEHTEPVGWWHFSHSYVRGSWRKESTTAPSLLTKTCHDIDFLLWMLCSSSLGSSDPPHLPGNISSRGSLKQFRRSMKPKEASNATNCMSCLIGDKCMYSARKIYWERHLEKGNARWPVEIVNPEVETLLETKGLEDAKAALFKSLEEDYNDRTPVQDIESRPWYGRCVWESDNDVCDDQFVTFEWDDDAYGRIAKTANFHMIAQTLSQCERRGWIYGTKGEIYYNSSHITLHDFERNETKEFTPEVPKNSHHGGGDDGLTQQFVKAVAAAKNGQMPVEKAQTEFLGVTIEECIRSHAAVFAAEEARRDAKVVQWKDWWRYNVERELERV
jgi:predicted dehydrogenase